MQDLGELAAQARAVGVRRVQIVAWRDLEDAEAGGSELHAHRIASEWSAGGLDVTVRTSAVAGRPVVAGRNGYRVVRRDGRYAVFPQVAWEGLRAGGRPADALVEVWNGMPFFSPIWFRGPRIVFLHHVHAEMWRMVLPPTLARIGEGVESSLAPLLYRRSRIVTLSASSKHEIETLLRIPPGRVTVVPPGVEPRFSPGGSRSEVPLVVAVGRLVPVKRLEMLIEALDRLKGWVPDLEAVIIGEGYERPSLEALRRRLGAESWLAMPGHVDDDALVDWYRRAWVVASASLREGWGMTLTEAGACGTPAVATRIAGHADAVVDGVSGLLVDDPDDMVKALDTVLTDPEHRTRLASGALQHARLFTWQAAASSALAVLVDEARRHETRR